jgi:osmoprotectant transport system permease protein
MNSNRSPRVNAIMVLGASIGLIALLLPWLLFKPNRLVLGSARSVWQLEPFWAVMLFGCWVLLLALSFVRLPTRGIFYTVLVALATLSSGFLTGGNTNALLKEAGEIARVSISGGAWLTLVAVYVATFAAKLEFRFAWFGPLLGLLVPLLANQFVNLGPVVEYRGVQDQFAGQLVTHLALAISSVVTASVIGFPLGVLASRNAKVEGLILGGAGLLQTIPSLALFGLLLPPLAWLGREARVGAVLGLMVLVGLSGAGLLAFARALKSRVLAVPAWVFMALSGSVFLAVITVMLFSALTGDLKSLSAWAKPNALLGAAGIRGIGAAPALLALTLYAFLPVVVNTFVGLRYVSAGVINAARGMGMNNSQVFWRAEVPIALPFLFEGLRGALGLTFGIATVAALIGGGGLGFFILRGVEGNVPDLVLLGALPVAVIALGLDNIMRGIGLMLTPKGLRNGVRA